MKRKEEDKYNKHSEYIECGNYKFKAGLFLVGLLCLCVGLYGHFTSETQNAASSSVVNGKKLPIYSVETEKKQVALSFDCAWGARRSATNEMRK